MIHVHSLIKIKLNRSTNYVNEKIRRECRVVEERRETNKMSGYRRVKPGTTKDHARPHGTTYGWIKEKHLSFVCR